MKKAIASLIIVLVVGLLANKLFSGVQAYADKLEAQANYAFSVTAECDYDYTTAMEGENNV